MTFRPVAFRQGRQNCWRRPTRGGGRTRGKPHRDHAADAEHRGGVHADRRERQRQRPRGGDPACRRGAEAKRDQHRHQHQPGAVRAGHHERPERQPGVPGRRAHRLRRAARQAKQRCHHEQADGDVAQHDAIHRHAERDGGGNESDRRGMPDRDRRQGPQRLRPIARAHAAGGGEDPAGGRVEAVQGAHPRDRQPGPEARHDVLARSARSRLRRLRGSKSRPAVRARTDRDGAPTPSCSARPLVAALRHEVEHLVRAHHHFDAAPERG